MRKKILNCIADGDLIIEVSGDKTENVYLNIGDDIKIELLDCVIVEGILNNFTGFDVEIKTDNGDMKYSIEKLNYIFA